MKVSYEKAYSSFSSGAKAGFLSQSCYSVDISNEYIENFEKIMKNSFEKRSDKEGMVELLFNRIYLIAEK